MKKITKVILTVVGFVAGTMMLGATSGNTVDFSWFGRFCLAGLVLYADYKLFLALDGTQEPMRQE